jgi:hypothetical protein
MGEVLNDGQRRQLDDAVQRARTAAELAAGDALRALAVGEPSRPSFLGDQDNVLRLALRDKARQLGVNTARSGVDLTALVREVAYEQWHRLLFARFLVLNGLLRHPEFRDTALSLQDCAELADDLGESDGWSVAARFASEILPGVFRLDDPAVKVRFAAEHRLKLERILLSIPVDVFVTEDALGWVYQFWQTAEKKRVNESGVKIGGADLSPVTQLFTENYMVRFLLENSLGAWWASRHPESSLADSWEYLRRLDDGTPAAGTFEEWPATAAEVTVMDPCCGSGHFLVAMFGMLWRMRAEEEGLSPADAQDAVLRDNLFGLELDPRCTQLATFNVALEAWKQGGFRDLPAPQIACSGIPVRASREDWEALAGSDDELRKVLGHLHSLFRNADTLGSLIDPRRLDQEYALIGRDLSVGVPWNDLRRLLIQAFQSERGAGTTLGHAAEDVLHAAELLSKTYTLVATNPPYLSRNRQSEILREHLAERFDSAKSEIAIAFHERYMRSAQSACMVLPQAWTTLGSYEVVRRGILKFARIDALALLGSGAFSAITGEVVNVTLSAVSSKYRTDNCFLGLDVSKDVDKEIPLTQVPFMLIQQSAQTANPDARILVRPVRESSKLLSDFASSFTGSQTGDFARFGRSFWEIPKICGGWSRQMTTVRDSCEWGGRRNVIFWEEGSGELAKFPGAYIRGRSAWGKMGVLVSRMGQLPVTLYNGDFFDDNAAVIIPNEEIHLRAIWHFLNSPDFVDDVRAIDSSIKVTNGTLVKVPFDLEHWLRAAAEAGDLSSPHSSDPTQWLFKGEVSGSMYPLQVAVARLLGFRWPDQEPDELDDLADRDGLAALQSLPGEPDLATRLRGLLAVAYGGEWSSALERQLVIEAGGSNGKLEEWLRDKFFAQHVSVFDNRPFLWHIWDGRKDGFSAIISYHRLDHGTLEKLIFASLGSWVERQKQEVAAGRAWADARLAAAEKLQEQLRLILDGVPPYDVYVRWKELYEQPIGWHPDLDDGVRLNIRPFVTAEVLRSKVNVHWKKDRGTNPDGSERINDLHPSLDERREARRQAQARQQEGVKQ